jgi:hypothetical protein
MVKQLVRKEKEEEEKTEKEGWGEEGGR